MADTTEDSRRKYTRRSAEQRIAELEARISEIKVKAAAKESKNDPIAKDIPKVQRRLRKFAQLAIDNDRMDLSNSTMAFVAQLERIRTKDLSRKSSSSAEGDA
ncbi:MAG: hypothetical protein ACI8QS_000513 [Planctomycetota bacterium]|jgi:hypothetical protein